MDLGLLQLVADITALCPEVDKRSELMRAHVDYLASPAAQDASRMGSGWVPPEAALAAAKQAELSQCWSCPT